MEGLTAVYISLGTFILIQVVSSVWWASRVNTILGIVQKDLGDLVAELKSMKENYVNKASCAEHKTGINQQVQALWAKVDQLQKKGE